MNDETREIAQMVEARPMTLEWWQAMVDQVDVATAAARLRWWMATHAPGVLVGDGVDFEALARHVAALPAPWKGGEGGDGWRNLAI